MKTIKEISIYNYKNIKSATINFENKDNGIFSVIGKNGNGKTNLLQALSMFQNLKSDCGITELLFEKNENFLKNRGNEIVIKILFEKELFEDFIKNWGTEHILIESNMKKYDYFINNCRELFFVFENYDSEKMSIILIDKDKNKNHDFHSYIRDLLKNFHNNFLRNYFVAILNSRGNNIVPISIEGSNIEDISLFDLKELRDLMKIFSKDIESRKLHNKKISSFIQFFFSFQKFDMKYLEEILGIYIPIEKSIEHFLQNKNCKRNISSHIKELENYFNTKWDTNIKKTFLRNTNLKKLSVCIDQHIVQNCNLNNIDSILKSYKINHLLRIKNEYFAIDKLSDGEKNLYKWLLNLGTTSIILEYYFFYEKYGSVLLIDEPELHLHQSLSADLWKLFNDFAKKNNVFMIVATHSPEFVNLSDINSILIAENITDNEDYSEIKQQKYDLISSNTHMKNLEFLLSYNSYGYNSQRPKLIFFVEGRSDKILIDNIFLKNNSLNCLSIPSGGKNNVLYTFEIFAMSFMYTQEFIRNNVFFLFDKDIDINIDDEIDSFWTYEKNNESLKKIVGNNEKEFKTNIKSNILNLFDVFCDDKEKKEFSLEDFILQEVHGTDDFNEYKKLLSAIKSSKKAKNKRDMQNEKIKMIDKFCESSVFSKKCKIYFDKLIINK